MVTLKGTLKGTLFPTKHPRRHTIVFDERSKEAIVYGGLLAELPWGFSGLLGLGLWFLHVGV